MLRTDKKIEKLYYTIGEVADLFEVNQSLIRFWEKEFDILKPGKNRKGNRIFTRKDIDQLKMIYHLVKERGYTLQGAREKLRTGGDEVRNNLEVIESLTRIRKFLLELRENV